MYTILIAIQSLHELLLVVDVAFMHIERAVQSFGGDDGIAHPRDVTQKVFLPFINVDVDIDVFAVDVPHGVLQNLHIAVAQFVVLFNELLLGLTIAFVGKLLRLENVTQLARLMNLSEGTLAD